MGVQVTDVQKALKGVEYPASRDDQVGQAADDRADDRRADHQDADEERQQRLDHTSPARAIQSP